jgi:CDP-glucose 4,6-dehydratase
MTPISSKFWKGKRVLLTGHTGFKGSWMALWLHRLGASVTGVSLPPITTPNLFTLAKIQVLTDSHFLDIRDAKGLAALIQKTEPEIIFHLAAQALVRIGYQDPLATFATNTQGTANILNSLREIDSVRVVVAVTTDKVYQNLERSTAYIETDLLGGHDPYSASKAAAEMVIACYRDSYLKEKGIAVASARAGNVIGGGDWSEDRLIPDAVRAWQAKATLKIRRPQAIRPWQHVIEPVAGYLNLAHKLWMQPNLAGAYNFGPNPLEVATVHEVIEQARKTVSGSTVSYDDGDNGPHEAGLLLLEITKAQQLLGFTPRWRLTETVKRTMAWYEAQKLGADARGLCEAEIAAYEALK